MKEEVFVECKGISIGYHDRSSASAVVKSNLSLSAFGGEMVGLLGSNGIGKSTLLKTIAGFQAPLSGELLIHDRSVTDYSPDELAREMSFVSTDVVRVANLTIREMVGLGRFPYTNWFGQLDADDHQIIEEAIFQVGLSGYENRFINRISDGERQRAMIARALAQNTRIMVLDEPTAFLDISNKYEIVRILHKLAEEHGKCVIFSTHDLNSALSMSDRIWLMLKDRVIEGNPEEVASGGYFELLFSNNPHLFFDPEKSDFRVSREKLGNIKLIAAENELIWATKALERIGFEINSTVNYSEEPVIEVKQQGKRWSISYSGNFTETESLGELCREIKKIRIQPRS